METRDIVSVLKERFPAVFAASVPLRKFAGRIWKMLISNPVSDIILPPSCFNISIEESRVVVAYAQRSRSGIRVLSVRHYPVDGKKYASPDELASFFEITRTDTGFMEGAVQLCIPKAWVILKEVEVPAAATANLPQVLAYEFDRFMPFSVGEAVYDYWVIPNGGPNIRLVLAACREQVLAKYLSALVDAGCTVDRVTFDLSAHASLCRFLTQQDSFVFVWFERSGLRGGRVEQGLLKAVFAEDIQGSFGTNSQFSAAVQAFFDSLISGQKEVPLYLTCAHDAAAAQQTLAQQQSFSFQKPDAHSWLCSGMADVWDQGPAAVGAATEFLWPATQGCNLLAKGVRVPTNPRFLITFVLLAAILICIGLYAAMPLQIEEKRLKEIDRQIAVRKDQVKIAESIIREIETIKREQALIETFRREQTLTIDILKELTLIIPKNAWLSRVRIAGNQVNLEGYSPSASGLIELLEASRYFQKVEFASPTFRDARQNMDRFQIKMELKETKNENK